MREPKDLRQGNQQRNTKENKPVSPERSEQYGQTSSSAEYDDKGMSVNERQQPGTHPRNGHGPMTIRYRCGFFPTLMGLNWRIRGRRVQTQPPLIKNENRQRQSQQDAALRHKKRSQRIAPTENATTHNGVIVRQASQQWKETALAVVEVVENQAPSQASIENRKQWRDEACNATLGDGKSPAVHEAQDRESQYHALQPH